MACASCGTTNPDGSPSGCASKGHCASGSCNRMNTYDWLTVRGIRDVAEQHFVEVSFKQGTRKDFFYSPPELGSITGDTVVVEADNGTDTGYITLSGELVFAQMRRRKVKASSIEYDVIRIAHDRDLERLSKARQLERESLVRARVLTYATELPMKLSDVEYQADLRKATFYYTSDSRIDFRELIKSLAREFQVRVEMRQIGARQEAGRLGGIGSCGRELCCSTWLTDFKNVNTSAARYQGLALNQTKLSGQCGRLKCCLNYELDTYLDALQEFPRKADKLRFPSGKAVLVKTDVFKRLMTYQVSFGKTRGPYVTLSVDQVHEVIANPEADVHLLINIDKVRQDELAKQSAEEYEYEDVTGAVDIPLEKRKRGKKKTQNRGGEQTRSSRPANDQSEQTSTSKNRRKNGPKPPRNRDQDEPQNRSDGGRKEDRPSDERSSRPTTRRPERKPRPPAGEGGQGDAPSGKTRPERRKRPERTNPEGRATRTPKDQSSPDGGAPNSTGDRPRSRRNNRNRNKPPGPKPEGPA